MFGDELNEPQRTAVEHTRGPLLVFAGAGSGKTRLITYRIARLVASEHVAPWRILAVTFTNKAAAEMRARVERLSGLEAARSLWVGTFHATCARLLRVHGAAVGVRPNFVIYDASDQRALLARVLKDLDLDERRFPPRFVLGHIHAHKQEGRGPDEAAAESYVDEIALRVFRSYEERLRACNALDFEDLILYVTRTLERTPEGDLIRRCFDYVLVDEFQDTNATQYRMIREIARDHRNLCVVGDDDQSVYRWRGADIRNIRGFRRDHPDATVVKLEQNYRSTGNIVAAALSIIGRSRAREPKELWTRNDAGDPLQVVMARDERDEAAFVVASILRAHHRGTKLADIAVFYRINAQSRVLEDALRQANVDYEIVGGLRFYERAEVKDALAYLRVIANPVSDVDMLRVINVPARGIGVTSVERLATWAAKRGVALTTALRHLSEIDDLGPGARRKIAAFGDLIERLRQQAEVLTPNELLAAVLAETNYVEVLRRDDTAESDARIENLRELSSSLLDYEAEAAAAGEPATLSGFLERITLSSDTDSVGEQGKVVLMTVHGAKGLEFDSVFLTGMEEDLFPYQSVPNKPQDGEQLEEERRLAYVAVTRARRSLAMTHTQWRQIFGKTRLNCPSRFLGELPATGVVRTTTSSIDRAGCDPEVQRDVAFEERISRGRTVGTPAARPVEGRFIDRSFFDDQPPETPLEDMRRGSRVHHERFGDGRVLRVVGAAEPTVVVDFPGWGEKKIVARFLKPA
ncbi:MAG: UvrD-helicase domain-containing protein [Polyangiaceae bacterium]|jgi:DNA helicase-2/ATP-dependent DNA helicase PcrA